MKCPLQNVDHRSPRLCSNVRRNLILISMVFVSVNTTNAQTRCAATTLQQANLSYTYGHFSTLFLTLAPCLPDGFSDKNDVTSAYRLMALSYVATDSLTLARSSIKQLLKYDSGYRPDPATEPPIYVDMVNEQIPSWYTYMWRGNSTSRWLARGLTIGALIAIPVIINGNQESDLPGPPLLPEIQ